MHRNRFQNSAPYLHRRRWSADDARAALTDLDASGLHLAVFAAGAGLDPQRLARWRRRLGTLATAPVFEEVALAPVPRSATRTVASVEQRERFEVVLASGRLVRVPVAFDAGALGRLLRVVDGEYGC